MSNANVATVRAPSSLQATSPGGGSTPDRDEIAAVVQSIVSTLRGDLTAAELGLYNELEGLARFIQHAKAEIAALRPDEIRERHLPVATDELDAIVGATEEATHAILDSVEKIEAAVADASEPARQTVAAAITRIYEACNFQDITGQRVTKVVKTLKLIEAKISELIAAFGHELGPVADRTQTPAPAEAGAPAEAELLNGPQLPGRANTQADIDALFNS
ncbi:MAG TPA: protein phosphatase CheZ [Alphaproteobacteria bacterium]